MALPNQSVQQHNRIKNMLGLQDVVQSDTLTDDVQLVKGAPPQGLSATSMSQPMGGGNITPQLPEAPTLNDALKEAGLLAVSVLADAATKGTETEKTIDRQEQQNAMQMAMSSMSTGLQGIGVPALQNNGINVGASFEEERASGGLIGMAAGGMFEGRVPGDGHGMEDNVYMPIRDGREQVGTLAVSPKEYVVDAYTMSALGNGNPDEGANVMDEVVENIREQAYGTERQPNEISGLAALRPMTERV